MSATGALVAVAVAVIVGWLGWTAAWMFVFVAPRRRPGSLYCLVTLGAWQAIPLGALELAL